MSRKIVILILVVLAAAAGVWFFAGGGLSAAEIRNVILISIDTCRADHLGCYGYPRKITPNIDALAEEAVVFENAICSVPITLPSHTTMLAGTTPLYHGVHDNATYRVAEYNRTIAQILAEHGYRTGAIVSATVLDSAYGLARGFDSYQDNMGRGPTGSRPVERPGGATTQLAVNWLDEHKGEKFFLFLHYFDPHFPYEPPAPFSSLFRNNLYAGEIAYTDSCIGLLIDKLKQSGLYDSTLLIITADHGEMLGEHSEKTHSYFIYAGAMDVPLIFRLPGQSRQVRISDNVGLVDIAPTICGMLGIEIPSAMQGRDLSQCLRKGRGTQQKRYIYCESLVPTMYRCNPLLGVVGGGYKYIGTTRSELYNTTAEPQEQNNLVTAEPKRAQMMKEELSLLLDKLAYEKQASSRTTASSQSLKQLGSLGYVSAVGGIDDSFSFDRSKFDPKDLIEFHTLNADATIAVNNKRYTAAEAICEKMLAARADFAMPYVYLAKIAFEQGDRKQGYENYYKYLKASDPNWAEPNRPAELYTKLGQRHIYLRDVHSSLGLAYYEDGNLDKAALHYKEALKFAPYQSEAHNNLAIVLRQQGDLAGAVEQYERALQLEPESSEAHYNLALVLQQQDKFAESAEQYRKCMQLNRTMEAPVNFRLGQLAFAQGDAAGAVEYMGRALELAPNRPEVLDGLSLIYAAGRGEFYDPNRAVALAQKACEVSKYQAPAYVKTLAAAYAAAGKTGRAVETAEKALALARKSGDKKLAAELTKDIESYRRGKSSP